MLILAAILAPRGASGGVHLVAPGVADVAGSNRGVVIHGSNFFQHRDTACRFGGAKVPGEVLDNGRFACVPPPAPHGAGFVYVEVSMNGQDFQGGRDTLVFEYVVPGRVASIRPTGADAGGGVLTHATADAPRGGGGGFAPASACTWFATDARGNVTSEVLGLTSRFVSTALVTCETPELDPGVHRVAVDRIDAAFDDRDSSADASRAFASWRSPGGELRWNGTAGAWRGGAIVAARWIGSNGGFGFGFGGFGSRHSCRFGTTSVAAAVDPGAGAGAGDDDGEGRRGASRGDATVATATCVSPAGTPGSVAALRLAPGPGSGAASYGTASHAYAGVAVDDASGAIGGVHRTVLGSFGSSGVGGFGSARSASPRGASTTGSHRFVAFVGANFDPLRSRCVVGAGQGSATSASAHVVSSALMLCELPPRAPGAAAIAAGTDALEQSSTEQSPAVLYAVEGTVSDLALEHADGIVWTDATPVGSTRGGDVVRVRGSGFVDGDGTAVGVRFGTIAPVRAGWISRDTVRTIAPAGAPGTVRVALDSFSSHPSLTSAPYAYADPGGLSECVSSPSIVPVTGEVRIELASWGGYRFGSIHVRRCAVGDAEHRLGCVAPAAKPGFAAVWVRGFDPDARRPPTVNVVSRPHVASLSPRTGFDAGGFLVSARGGDFVETALGAGDAGLECVFGSVGVEARFVSTALVLCEAPPAASTGAVTVEIAAGRGVAASQSEIIMTYSSAMRVDRVAPARGPTEGGNVLTVYGANFVAIEPTACKIGTIGPLDARDNDAPSKGSDATTGLECVAPAAELGAYLVSAGIRTAGYTGDDVRYEYENAKHVAAIVPAGGSSRVATPVSLYGATIHVGSSSNDCVVGNVRVPGVVVFAGEVRCELPAGTFRGFVAVGVGGLRAESLDVVVYEFKTPVRAIGTYPRSGYVHGGSVTFVTSRHARLGGDVGCAVGDDAGHAAPVSSALVACETPGGDVAGELGATLLDGPVGVPAGDAEAAYRYRAEETVRGVEPEAATAAGGVAVLVATGSSNANSMSLACAFGTIAPVRARASDRSGFVECVAPNVDPSLAGAFVSVRLGVGCEFGRGGAALRIVSAPVDGTGVPTSVVTDDPREEKDDVAAVMLSASPATGSVDGGARLAVFGSNLARYPSNLVRFGDIAVVGHFVSSALVVVETPAVDYFGPTRLGDGDVVFSYVESARVDSVSPSVVHPSGGTALAIKGSFGRGVFYCRVGTIGPISASSVDAGTVECVAPARDEGAAVVTVASGFGDVHGQGEVSLTYELPRVKKADEDKPPEPEVAAVVPFAGPLGGGSPVYVIGKELTALASSFIEFGGAMAPSHAVSSAVVIVEAPPGDFLGSVAVHGSEGLSGRFAYVEDVDEFTVEPAVVGIDGGATITLVGASLGSGRTARTACRIGTVGPIAASYAGGHRFECRAPATVRGTRTVAAGTHDGSAWTAGGLLLATHAPRDVFASPPATPSGTDVFPAAAVSFFGLWLHAASEGARRTSSSFAVSFVDAGSDSRFVAVRVDHVVRESAPLNALGVDVFVERFAPPKVRSVASAGGGIEGGSVAYVFGGDFDDAESSSCVFASRAGGFDVLPASAAGVAADVVSGALIRCETPALVDGAAAPMFGYGGGDASLHVQHRGGLAASPTAAAWSAAPTPWIKETSPSGGSAAGGTLLRVTAAGAVESIQSRGARGVSGGARQSRVVGGAAGGAAAACAFGSVGPVATRDGGGFTDVECVVPAGRGAVDVRIFSQRSVCLPRSPRAAPNGGVGAFAYATEGRVYDALPGGGGFGRTESKAAVLGVGLTLPRGAAVACLVDGDATRALSATSSSVACDVPPGPSGFVVVAVSDAVGSVQTSRSQPPRTYAAYPSAVDAGGGGVLSLAGVDMHRAVGFTFGGDDGAMVSSALGVVVSSALAVVEAPGAEKVVRRPADVVAAVAVAVGATRGGPIGYDAAGPAPPSSASVWLTPSRAIERVSPASGPAGGGQAVSFSLFPKLAGGWGSDGDGGAAASAECWFGTFGPVRGRDDGARGIECVTVAHVPGAVETHAAARPDACAGGYARRFPAIGGLSEISEDFESAEIPDVSYSFFASRFDRDGLSATTLRSVSVVSRAGLIELAVPFDYDGGVSLDGVAGPLAIEKSPLEPFGVATVKIPPFTNRGGFFALSLAASGAGDVSKPFGQVRVVPAPELGSANPSLQPKDGGGVLWIVGSNLLAVHGGESELVVVVASSSSDSVSSAVAAHVVSSAIAAFESPAMPSGAASLTPSAAGVAVPESAVAAAYLTRAAVAGAEPSFTFSSGSAGGAPVRISGVGFRDTGLAACAFGAVAPVAATVASSGEMTCAPPSLTPGRSHVVGVSFNRRDFFRGDPEGNASGGDVAALVVAAPPVALAAVIPSAVSEPIAAGASVDVVGAGFRTDSSFVSPCGGFGTANIATGSTRGIARCPPGALVAAGASVASQGFIAVAVAAVDGSSGAGHYSRDSLAVLVYAAPVADSVAPDVASAAGGSVAVVAGRNLRRGDVLDAFGSDADARAIFGDVAVPMHAVSSAVALCETPPASGGSVSTLAVSREVFVVAGAADPSAGATSLAATGAAAPTHSVRPEMVVREVHPRRAPVTGGSVATIRGENLGVPGALGQIWCKAGTVGPVAGRRAVPVNETTGDSDAGAPNAPASMEVRCVLPAGLRLGVVGVTVSDNRRDFSRMPPATRITRTPRPVPPQNASAPPPPPAVSSSSSSPPPTPPLALDGNATHLGYDHDLVFTEALDPTWTFEYVQPAVLEHAMPPAAIPGAGGVFGSSNGLLATFAAPIPSPAIGALASRSGAVVGCQFGVVAAAPRGRRLASGVGWIECAAASSDPFAEGLLPVFAAGWDSAAAGVQPPGRTPVQFEFIQPPQMFAWQPRLAHVGGGAVVRVVGMDLRVHDASLVCVFATGPRVGGDVSGFAPAVPAAVAVSTAVAACECPGDLPEGVAALSVGTAGSTPTPGGGAAAPLSVVARPSVVNVSPTAGSVGGGAAVTLHGERLRPASGTDDLAARVGTFAPVAVRPGAATGSVEIVTPARVAGLADVATGRSASDYASILGGAFSYREPFAVSSASPSAVAAAGGARVTLFGRTGFLPEDGEWSGRLGLVRTRSNQAAVVAPPRPGGGFYALTIPDAWEVSTNGVGRSSAVLARLPQLEHRAAASVASVSPRAAAPGGGGSLLDVVGANLHREFVSVRLGEFSAAAPGMPTAQVVSSVLLRVEVCGDHHHDTRAPAEVASSSAAAADEGAWSSDGVLVAFHRHPSTLGASPAHGGEGGGTAVRVTGSDFRDAGAKLLCAFGSVVVSAAGFVSTNRVDCVSPARAPDVIALHAPLAVSVNGRDFSSRATDAGFPVTFSYGARVEVYGLAPDHGPSLGGTLVTVRGANFVPAAWEPGREFAFSCRFGAKVAPAVGGSDALTASSASCRSPPHAAGFVAVEVSAGGGNFSSFGVVFEYQASAAPDVLFPPVGLASGGTLVTVVGSNFIASQQHAGYGHGMVAQPGSGSGSGSGSGDALSCRFGGVYVSGASAVSSSVLRCETPTFADATIDRALAVDASNNGGVDFAQSSTYFEPLGEALVSALEPRAGTAGGGTVVSVYGVGFTADEPVWCRFGTTGPIPAAFLRDGIVRCKSPAKATHKNGVPLEVSRGNTFDVTRNNVIFDI